NYLFGNPAGGLQAEVTMTLQQREKQVDRFPGYSFANQTARFEAQTFTLYQDKLPPDGHIKMDYPLPGLNQPPGALQAEIKASVLEKGGRASENRITLPVEPYPFYVGLLPAAGEYGYVQVGEPNPVKAVLVNTAGNSVAGRPLHYKIYLNSRYWWWEYDNRRDFELRFKSDSQTELLEEGTVVSQNLPVEIPFKPESRGEYLLEVQVDGEEGHTAGMFIRASYWGEAAGPDDAGLLALTSDKEVYRPGETARVSFPAPAAGTILLSVESAGKILETRWKTPRQNRKESTFEIRITEEMLPNAYVSVSLIQPHSITANDRPMRLYGVIPLKVESPGTRLPVEISMPDTLASQQQFTVRVQTGSPAQFTIAVVDEGLLSLTRFRTPDPFNYFYQKMRLQVTTYDLFSQVIGALRGDVFKTFSIGGGITENERLDQLALQKVRRFKPLSLFKGPLTTDENGRATVTFQLPRYVGAVRVMVVAAEGIRYGSAEKSVPVQTELMVLPTLPRFISPGDEFRLPATVFTMKDEIRVVRVSLETGGLLQVQGDSRKSLRFEKSGEQDLFFNLKAEAAAGSSQVKITAASGSYRSISETPIALIPASPRRYQTFEKELAAGETVEMTVPNRGIAGTNRARVRLHRVPRLDIGDRLYWLIRYPYGCLEQTVSSVFPQLYLKMFLTGEQQTEKDIDENLNGGISRLQKFSLPSGALSLWPGNSEPDIWSTSYAGHFLIEARKLGYHVPENLWNNWMSFERSRALTGRDGMLQRVYRVYLLALAGQAAEGPMNLLRENYLQGMTAAERWLLAAAYHLNNEKEVAGHILRNTGTVTREYQDFNPTFGSALRDKALILLAALEMKRWETADSLYLQLTENLSWDQWYSTQTTGFSLLALGKYIHDKPDFFGEPDSRLKGYFVLPSGEKSSFNTRDFQVTREIESGFGKPVQVHLDEGELPKAFAVVEWEGIPLQDSGREISRHLTLQAEWFNEDGIRIDPGERPQGSVFWLRLRVGREEGTTRDMEELALVQMLPAGWEIENIRLSGENLPEWMGKWPLYPAEYTDIRDDRIMWFFDLNRHQKIRDFAVKLTAVTVGQFSLPPTVVHAMYNNEYRAELPGHSVVVNSR
ncbi:MAG: alpha-2-macroglobulin family protein, partial [Calditrichia bacterium]